MAHFVLYIMKEKHLRVLMVIILANILTNLQTEVSNLNRQYEIKLNYIALQSCNAS